ncbi:MAG: aldehyde dehydrogenase family protein [Hyphomonadaceae bacterium]|nr:aldehyde dehydrogenase family protein [Hyphomonadaceae bacterium]
MADYRMLINGELVGSGARLDVINPATGEVLAQAPDCSREQLDAAVAAAQAAFPAWRDTPHAERAAKLGEAAGIIQAHGEELKSLLTAEQGKCHDEAFFEVMGGAGWLQAVASLDIAEQMNPTEPGRSSRTVHVPIGVVGAISPWNFPVLLSMWKVAPALAAGNTLVLKPSPFTPLTILRIAELLKDVFPAGVLNVVTGGDNLGPWMTSHPGMDKISFTGSTATGKKVMESASRDLKRVTLELGGNDAAIVLKDADIATSAKALAWGAFRNTGQVCINAKRIYVADEIYDDFAEAFVAEVESYVVGDGAEQGVQLGPIQNKRQYERVRDLLADCRANGYSFLTGGEETGEGPGYFLPLTVVDNPPDESRIVREEPFGPVVPLLRYNSVDEVLERANASEFGLAGSVWGADLDIAEQVAMKLETGTVWINEIHQVSPFEPFAGHKQSGMGVENGLAGLLEYTLPKTITRALPAG